MDAVKKDAEIVPDFVASSETYQRALKLSEENPDIGVQYECAGSRLDISLHLKTDGLDIVHSKYGSNVIFARIDNVSKRIYVTNKTFYSEFRGFDVGEKTEGVPEICGISDDDLHKIYAEARASVYREFQKDFTILLNEGGVSEELRMFGS